MTNTIQSNKNPRVIALYLPQYYITETNNKWYGNGFTEWTNVGKARPLFKNHYQPKVPADLGYYNLKDSEIRQKQAELAKKAGIEGFCYYHYWFGEGRQELEVPFSEVVKFKEPDFPFCLCWANQSWYSKFWNGDAECSHKIIVEQKYDNDEWIEKHFYNLLEAFKDERYIKINGKLLFMIYRPLEYTGVKNFMCIWNNLAYKNNLLGFHFIGQANNELDVNKILGLGLNGVNIVRKDEYLQNWRYSNKVSKLFYKLCRVSGLAPYRYNYKSIYKFFIKQNGIESNENIYPTIIPNWDHSPRSGKRGSIFYNSTPNNFEYHLKHVLELTSNKQTNKQTNIVFLKSWNEWGEGNYIEPCLRYGHGYIDVLNKYLKSNSENIE